MSEQWYDEEIAPKLRELCNACKNRGVSFSATVEYAAGERGETRWMAPGAGLPMAMLALINHSGDNVDGFMIGLIRHCRKNGIDWNNSAVMRQFGGKYSGSQEEV